MNELIKKIAALSKLSKVLEPNMTHRDQYYAQVNSFSNEFIQSLGDQKTFNPAPPETPLFAISEKTKTLEEIINIFQKEVPNKGINAASGKHFGYIPGGGIFSASLGDFMVAVSNEYAGMHYASPGGVAMENELIRWMCTLFDYPATAIGNLTSGGSIANLIALTSARDKHQIKGALIEKSVIYLSKQAHHCIQKALRIIGLEDCIIRYVDIDNRSRMLPLELDALIRQDIDKGLNPFLVVASAGTTDTGAVDPLEEIALISKKYQLWFHVDAAYGGFFKLIDSKNDLFKGIELSDSLVVDPHKGLFLPYGIGAVLVKDKKAVFHSHHQTASYMQDALQDSSPLNPADVSPELTRHFRGMRMWLPLQLHGIKPFKACLEEKLYLTEYMRSELQRIGFSLGPEPDLSVSYFWYSSKTTDLNRFNRKLLDHMHANGSSFFSSTLINNQFVIRIAILSFRTKLKEVDQAILMIEECLDKTLCYFEEK
ncbi:pyridoxal phosphate-dependent decarboxylase family protein [Lutimonas sp.]|uniref:pyridoxal phosphate-dependent decarboxylase family protein n=1 Tax=Lutimonas sp. TaxID=1872403 RepID=UPI003D9AFAAD